jgi:hypothetical protein
LNQHLQSDQSVRQAAAAKMKKQVERKEDGRTIIFYSFESAVDDKETGTSRDDIGD